MIRFSFEILVWSVLITPTLLAQSSQSNELSSGTRVEVDAIWKNGVAKIIKVEREKADLHPEIKGYFDRVDLKKREIYIAPFTIEVPYDVDIEDDHVADNSYRFDELLPTWRLKIEVEIIGYRRCRALKIDVDKKKKRKTPPVIEIESVIEKSWVDRDGVRRFVLLGLQCELVSGVTVSEKKQSTHRLVDDDDARPLQQFQPFKNLFDSGITLTLGGEVQLDYDYKDNYDLDDYDNKDTSVLGTSTTLEALLSIGYNHHVFVKMGSSKDYVFDDEKRNLKLEESTNLHELHWEWRGFILPELDLRIGRQDFDEEREWLYDDNLDAIRLIWSPDKFEFEYSWSTLLADAPRERREVMNQMLVGRWYYERKSYLSLYMLDIQDRSRRDNSPFFLGGRVLSRTKQELYWFDYSYVDGVDGLQEISAHGLDFGYGRRFTDLPMTPYFYASYAWGSGDAKTSGGTNRGFRQTGLQDNNQKFFGVAAFRYYGELLRPELSNLHIYTLGLGCRPSSNTSVDFILHAYRQDQATSTLRDSDLRMSPEGIHREIGEEIDLVIGFDDVFGHLDVEFDFGYFVPGRAFSRDADAAFKAALQLEWNF